MAQDRADQHPRPPGPAGTGTIRLNAADLGLEPAQPSVDVSKSGTIQASAAELGLLPDTEAMMQGETAVAGSMAELLQNLPPEKSGSSPRPPATQGPGAASTKVNLEATGARPQVSRKGSRSESPAPLVAIVPAAPITPAAPIKPASSVAGDNEAATLKVSPAEMARLRDDSRQAGNLEAAAGKAGSGAKLDRAAAGESDDGLTVRATAEEMARIRDDTRGASDLQSAASDADGATVQASPADMARILEEKRKAGDSRPAPRESGVERVGTDSGRPAGASTRGNLPRTGTTKDGVKDGSRLGADSKLKSGVGSDTRPGTKDGGRPATVSEAKKKEIADDPLLEGIPDGPNGTKMIDNYQILHQLGKGGMGTVYFARDTVMRRDCAIKVLAPSAAASKEAVRRFEVEAAAAALIGREAPDNIVQVYSTGRIQQLYYLVMEYVGGGSLEDRLKERKVFPEYESLTILRTACSVLDIGTQYNIIHRDLKPDNIMIAKGKDGRETLKLADLGLAKFLEDDVKADESGGIMRGTVTGVFMGTPHYMSPEQMKDAKSVDHRADIYSLGIMFYRMLTGKLPFNHPEFRVLINQVMEQQIPDPRRISDGVDVSDACTFIVDKMTRKAKEERFQNYKELMEVIDRRLQELEASSKGALLKASPWAVRTTGFSASNTEFDAGARPATAFFKVPSGARPSTWVAAAALMMVAAFWMLILFGIVRLRDEQQQSAQEATLHWDQQRILTDTGGFMEKVQGRVSVGMTPDEAAWVTQAYGWPAHADSKVSEVDVPEFYVCETAVTNAQFYQFVRAQKDKSWFRNRQEANPNFLKQWKILAGPGDSIRDGSAPPKAILRQPVVYIDLDDAKAYAAWMTQTEVGSKHLPPDWIYRLPTEAEWELAARGAENLPVNKDFKDHRRSFPWGSEFVDAYCYDSESVAGKSLNYQQWGQWAESYRFTHTLEGAIKPQLVDVDSDQYKSARSPYGCYLMAGNVWEMTATVQDGQVVSKGGSWFSPAPEALISQRLVTDGTKVMPDVGFRLVAGPAKK
ncbi:MAG: protein kinase domain-containing protein [Planctomycetota bacterium]